MNSRIEERQFILSEIKNKQLHETFGS
ncbi:protein of unknown function [Shewanella benthica]|uniref:Uncharacterized protein n=1 Tax=Shewanella benthica TaxID=43661 RepID=A0A330M9I8_9GAMM|nr:protein of unknown function [Shewanella benthica]